MKGAQLAAAVKFSRAGTAEKPGFLHTDLDSEADKEHNLTKARLTGRGGKGSVQGGFERKGGKEFGAQKRGLAAVKLQTAAVLQAMLALGAGEQEALRCAEGVQG